jgi:N-acyl homoserine lactone hydrolase
VQLYLLELAVAGGYPIPGALVHLDDGRWVLVDTGPAPRGGPPGDSLTDDERWAALVELYGDGPGARAFQAGDPDRALPAQLSRLGLTPGDVSAVISTHLDQDHAGHHHLFPHAEHWIQAEHLAWARATSSPRIALNRSSWRGPLRWRAVSGDVEIAPGLRVLSTPGHVPGHQSVLVQLPTTGAVLLASDAVTSGREFRADRGPGYFDLDGAAAVESTLRLLDLCRQAPVALAVFGHDPEQWPTLRHAPLFYD